jgi:hypothetical protein
LGDEDLDLDDEESDEDDLGDFIVNRVDARGEAIDAPRRRRKRAKVAPAVRATSRQMMDAARIFGDGNEVEQMLAQHRKLQSVRCTCVRARVRWTMVDTFTAG